MLFTLQLLLAFIPAILIAVAVSMAGSVLRYGAALCCRQPRTSSWKTLSWEGVAVGLIDFVDAAGVRHRQQGTEGKTQSASERITNRVIRWSSGQPARVVVELPETGMHLFFPTPINTDRFPPEAAVEAYLRGEPVGAIRAMID